MRRVAVSPVILLAVLSLGGAAGGDGPAADVASEDGDPVAAAPLVPRSAFRLRAALAVCAALDDPAARAAALDALCSALRADGRLPFVAADTAVFLYRGPARTVAVAGDFNGWRPEAGPLERLGHGDVWLRTEVFPRGARLDYKFVLNGDTWLLDPENPRRQRGGFGDNSELRMPAYRPSPWVEERPGVARGALAPGRVVSAALGHPVRYQVYRPAGADTLGALPVIYVTDGHEYADPRLGGMVQVLDNLIAAGEIRPVMAVFIDPRVEGVNRRRELYVLEPRFARFVAEELVPTIDAAYPTDARRAARAILGTSLGGLNAAYLAMERPGVFGLVAMQSPAFHAGDAGILELYERSPRLDVEMVLSWGTFHDFGPSTEAFLAILDAKGYRSTALVTDEGHSWGQWRALLDDVLRAFWAAR